MRDTPPGGEHMPGRLKNTHIQGYPPAELILEECVARGLAPSALGAAWIIASEFRPLSRELAGALSDGLGKPRINPQLWLNLDKEWQKVRMKRCRDA